MERSCEVVVCTLFSGLKLNYLPLPSSLSLSFSLFCHTPTDSFSHNAHFPCANANVFLCILMNICGTCTHSCYSVKGLP